jgi:hypothetical protein
MQTIRELLEAVFKNILSENPKFLRNWYDKFDSELWDKQFEKDVASGKLNQPSKQAIIDFHAGNYEEI